MNWKAILRTQGILQLILSAFMFLPFLYSLYHGLNDIHALGLGTLVTALTGLFLFGIFFNHKNDREIRARDGFAAVSLGWIFAAASGALPFYFHHSFGPYINCLFESMSGFTTTGASILTDIESIPRGLLLWRSLTHWLGGMGIMLLTIAVLPAFGISYSKLFNAEMPGPTKDRISPKIRNTAKILWFIYAGMTLLQTVLLMAGGMDWFDALSHTFGTLATGGFSTYNASIAHFNSLFIEIVIIFFMYLAGINFSLHFQLMRGNIRDFFKNREWQVYTVVLIAASLFVAWNLYQGKEAGAVHYSDFSHALRVSVFQVVSITTTTGFITDDFSRWPAFSQWLLVFLMFIGGSAGSTAGGIKQIRIIIVLKSAWIEMKKMLFPNAVFSLKISGKAIRYLLVNNIIGFVTGFIALTVVITLIISLRGYDMITAFSSTIATLGNVGPGLARVGAVENYAFFDPFSKGVLVFSMLLGRLEIYSVLILIYSLFRRAR